MQIITCTISMKSLSGKELDLEFTWNNEEGILIPKLTKTERELLLNEWILKP